MNNANGPDHTEGPWQVVEDGGDSKYSKYSIRSINGYWVAATVGCLPGLEEELANATLIAAAPTTLAALKMLLRAINVKVPDPLEVFAAIEKARHAVDEAEVQRETV